MQDKIEAVRTSANQEVQGAAACRAILAALGAELGKPIAMPGAPVPSPLAGIERGQTIDLLVAKLSSMLPKEDGNAPAAPPPLSNEAPPRPGVSRRSGRQPAAGRRSRPARP